MHGRAGQPPAAWNPARARAESCRWACSPGHGYRRGMRDRRAACRTGLGGSRRHRVWAEAAACARVPTPHRGPTNPPAPPAVAPCWHRSAPLSADAAPHSGRIIPPPRGRPASRPPLWSRRGIERPLRPGRKFRCPSTSRARSFFPVRRQRCSCRLVLGWCGRDPRPSAAGEGRGRDPRPWGSGRGPQRGGDRGLQRGRAGPRRSADRSLPQTWRSATLWPSASTRATR